jgi:hypothetical protein
MRKRKVHSAPSPPPFLSRWANLLWGFLAITVWAGEQAWHARQGTPFSLALFLKGFLLLAGATALYQGSATKAFSFLGFFPLLWLAVSKFQWDLCASGEIRPWLWLILFLIAEIVLLGVKDEKKRLYALAPLWAVLCWIFPFSFFLPLMFLRFPVGWLKPFQVIRTRILRVGYPTRLRWFGFLLAVELAVLLGVGLVWLAPALLIPLVFWAAPQTRLRISAWTGKATLAVALGLFILFQGWKGFGFHGTDLYQLLVTDWYVAFFLLGWLGMIAFSQTRLFPNRNSPNLIFPMFLLVVGFFFWTGPNLAALETGILKWVLVLMAGFGWESFRRDLMDSSWHGRMVWFALGVWFFSGVL